MAWRLDRFRIFPESNSNSKFDQNTVTAGDLNVLLTEKPETVLMDLLRETSAQYKAFFRVEKDNKDPENTYIRGVKIE
jgi:hypothetical protein